MEQNKPALMPSKSFEVSNLVKISRASQGLSIADAEIDDIRSALRYIFTLIGIPAASIPAEEDKDLLISFIKNNLAQLKIDEIKLAFDLAVLKTFEVDLILYGEPFSVKYLTMVINAYKQFKMAENRAALLRKKKAEVNPADEMNNSQRLASISSLLTPETKELIDRIGSQKERMAEIRKHPYYEIHQKWFKQFDFLLTKFRHKYDFEGKKINGKFINRYGQIMNVEMFFNKKVEQLQIAKERNTDKL